MTPWLIKVTIITSLVIIVIFAFLTQFISSENSPAKPTFYCNGTDGVYYSKNYIAVQTYDAKCCEKTYCLG